MPHRLQNIEIQNFRSCIGFQTRLSAFTPIIGYNNAGKSNILNAILWIIKPWALAESEFNDKEKPVIVEASIEGLTPEHLAQLHENHRVRIDKYVADQTIRIQRRQMVPGGSVTAVKPWIQDPKVEEGHPDAWVQNPTGISEAIQDLFPDPFFVNAMEDAAEDASKASKGSTLSQFIAELVGNISKKPDEKINEHLSSVSGYLHHDGGSRPEQLQQFDTDATAATQAFFPGIKVRVHIPTPSLGDLFKSGTLKLSEDRKDQPDVYHDFTSYGHGTQRSIQMALVSMLAQRQSKKTEAGEDSPICRLLLLEEPELYLHPEAIEALRRAFCLLAHENYQIICATHSPMMICQDSIPDAVLVFKTTDHGTQSRPTVADAVKKTVAEAPAQARTIFGLTHTRMWLFSNQVLLVEGDTEQTLIPELFDQYKKERLLPSKVAIVSQGGCNNTANSIRIFEELRIPCKAVVDLDFALKNAPYCGLLAKEDPRVEAAKVVFAELRKTMDFEIGEDGFPARCKDSILARTYLKPAIAFGEFAKHPDGKALAESLHTDLLATGIWLWKGGCIEHHLGMLHKGEIAWANYIQELKANGFETTVNDPAEVKLFLDWLATPPAVAALPPLVLKTLPAPTMGEPAPKKKAKKEKKPILVEELTLSP